MKTEVKSNISWSITAYCAKVAVCIQMSAIEYPLRNNPATWLTEETKALSAMCFRLGL